MRNRKLLRKNINIFVKKEIKKINNKKLECNFVFVR